MVSRSDAFALTALGLCVLIIAAHASPRRARRAARRAARSNERDDDLGRQLNLSGRALPALDRVLGDGAAHRLFPSCHAPAEAKVRANLVARRDGARRVQRAEARGAAQLLSRVEEVRARGRLLVGEHAHASAEPFPGLGELFEERVEEIGRHVQLLDALEVAR